MVVPLFLVRVWQLAGLFETARADLERQAHHDDLTGLPNRRAATAHLTETVQHVEDGTLAAARVCFLDLDDFKAINDDHGHGAGDAVLAELGARLRACAQDDDFVARLGGDEFVVVHPCEDDELEALTIDRVRDVFAEPIAVQDTVVRLGVSIGSVTVTDREHLTVERVLSLADSRMYADKRRDRSAG